eukprot:GEMP01042115.1.p1 GENE.GEMP01042115.1~~GEMP01042115.1.p1  ORF type:complete len:401 (+),score=72.90 GEMP01042115.1:191-1393(+)
MAFLSLIGFFALIEKTHGFKARSTLVINSEANQGPLSVFTTTWNMGDQDGSDETAVSEDTLKKWLFPDHDEIETKQECSDIFIIATEEQRIPASDTVLRTSSEEQQTNHEAWVRRVSFFLNATCKVQPGNLNEYIGATSLMVFSAEKLTLQESFKIRRGVGAFVGDFFSSDRLGANKGLAVIRFTHPRTKGHSIVAVAAHLAAHEGKDDDRIADLKALKHELQLSEREEATVFLAGDLNIRIANDKEGECSKHNIQDNISSPSLYKKKGQLRRGGAVKKSKGQRGREKDARDDYLIKRLSTCDELVRENEGHLQQGNLLQEFWEAQITFLPTFKLEKESTPGLIKYSKRRAPAWTDRVLVRPGVGVAMVDETDVYQSNEKVHGSDHMPVYLRVKLNFQKK